MSVGSSDQFTVVSVIHITDVHSDDLGTYNCTAINDYGVTSIIITLHVKGMFSYCFIGIRDGRQGGEGICPYKFWKKIFWANVL